MNEGQANIVLQQNAARYVTTKQGIQWWKTRDGYWIAKRMVGAGLFELRKLPPNACGC